MSAVHRQISVWTIAGEIKSQAIGDGAMGPWETDMSQIHHKHRKNPTSPTAPDYHRRYPTITDSPRLSPTAPDYRRRSPTIANKRNEAQTVAAVPIANFLRLSCNIGDFLVAFCLCFETSPGADPFTWKLVLFTCKWTNIFMWIKRVSIRKVLYWDSLWNRGEISCYNFRKTGFRCKRDVTRTRLFRLSDRRRTCCLWTRPK